MNSNIFDKTGWRLGRWLVTGFVILAIGVLSPPGTWQSVRLLFTLVLGGDVGRAVGADQPAVSNDFIHQIHSF